MDGLRFASGAIAHFHSWESGILIHCEEFRSYIRPFKTIFSPYLTTSRLKPLVEHSDLDGWTMSREELVMASSYERKLCESCMRVVLESARDRDHFSKWVHPDKLDIRCYALERSARFPTDIGNSTHLSFIAGGRPVREKGFVELCREFALVRDWAGEQGISVQLSILCRERRREKGAAYLEEVERTIAEHDLTNIVKLEPKISLEQLRTRIAQASALIVPSLYDPFCLMPTYSVELKKPALVSRHAGISENIRSRQFIFDPQVSGDLARAVAVWHADSPAFEFEACFPSYEDLYLAKESPSTWG
jgi:glycosyltransferase involved in cell wall biosynthesis